MAARLGLAWAWSLGAPDRAGQAPGLLREALGVLPAWLQALRRAPGQHHLAVDPAWLDLLGRVARGVPGLDPHLDLLALRPEAWGPEAGALALALAPSPEAAPWPAEVTWLLRRREQALGHSLAGALRAFSPEEQAQLVAWSAVEAVGWEALADWPEVKDLLLGPEGPGPAQRLALAEALRSRVGHLLQALRRAVQEGLLHPALAPLAAAPLPLLADLALGRPPGEAPLPELHLPPEALLEVWRLGGQALAHALDAQPQGAIPPHLAASLPVADAAAAAGARWLLLDESALVLAGADLGRSPEGVPWDARLLYGGLHLDTPSGPLGLAFRDAHLSDRLAFHHARLAPEEAGQDLAIHLEGIRRLLPDGEGHALTLALDVLAFGRGREGHGAHHLEAWLEALAALPGLQPQAIGALPPQRQWWHLAATARHPLSLHAKGPRARRLWAQARGLAPAPWGAGSPPGALSAALKALALAHELGGEGAQVEALERGAALHLAHAAQLLGAPPPPVPAPRPLPPVPPALPELSPKGAAAWRLRTAPLPTPPAATGPLGAPKATRGDGAAGKLAEEFPIEPAAPVGPPSGLWRACSAWIEGECLVLEAQATEAVAGGAWLGLCYPGLPAATSPWPAKGEPGLGPTARYRFTHAWALPLEGPAQWLRAKGEGGWQAREVAGEHQWAGGRLRAVLPLGELGLPAGLSAQLVLAALGAEGPEGQALLGVAPPEEPLGVRCPMVLSLLAWA